MTTKPSSPCRSQARTLRAAHELVIRKWPGRDASDSVWLAYHQCAAAVFSAVAEIDQAHHNEALYWAQCERDAAQAVAEQVRTGARVPAKSITLDKGRARPWLIM